MRHIAGFVIFLIILVSAYAGMHYYLASWLTRHFVSLSGQAKQVRIILLLVALSFPVAMALPRAHQGPVTHTLAYLGLLWAGLAFMWFSWAVAGDLLELLSRIVHAPAAVKTAVKYGVIVIVALGGAYSYWLALQPPRVTRIEIPVKNLPKELEGFTIAQVTDVHLGITVFKWQLDKIISVLNGLKPDLVAFTGDLLDPGFRGADVLTGINRRVLPKHRKFGVFGNHEFYLGIPQATANYKEAGITLLRGASATLPNGLQVVGVDDIMTAALTKHDVSAVLKGLDPAKPSVFLCHQPLDYDVAEERGVNLILSGHTHDGQIFPFNLLVKFAYQRVFGLFKNNGTYHYVSSGAAYWGPPLRFFTRHEIPFIVLTHA